MHQSLIDADPSVSKELISPQFRRILVSSVLRIVRHTADAEDVVQQALLHAFQHADQFEGKAKFSTYCLELRFMRRSDECAASDI